MQAFIFDANFFINLNKVGHYEAIDRFRTALKKISSASGSDSGSSSTYITNLVFRELKSLSPESLSILKRVLNIVQITPTDIQELTKDKNPRRNPQDPDLSLVALGQKLLQQDPKRQVTIVTFDYKLINFIRSHTPKIQNLPPSTFVIHMVNNLQDPNLVRYFNRVRRQIMYQYEIQYMMQRKDTYNPQEKLRWLVEKALAMAKTSTFSMKPGSKEDISADSTEREKFLISRYLKGENLPKNQMKVIKVYMPYLNWVNNAEESLNKVVGYLETDQLQKISKYFQQISRELLATLQLSQVKLTPPKSLLIFELISTYLARFEFLSAISLVEVDMEEAMDHFNNVLLYSLMAGQNQNLIMINYFKALTIFFNSGGETDYRIAADQFHLTQDLADSQKNLHYYMLSRFGEAISRFLSGEGGLALDIMTDINKLSEKHLDISLDLWIEFGDNFYMIGQPGIAANLYREALEIAVELKRSESIEDILEKLKKCILATGSYTQAVAIKLEKFIDLAHEQDSDSTSYNEAISKIAEMNKQLYEKFPYFTKQKWLLGNELSFSLDKPFDVVDHVMITKTKGKKKVTETTFYCYSSELGGIAIKIPEEIPLRVPESYNLTLNPKKEYKIVPPTLEEKSTYFIRAIINAKNKDAITLSKVIPAVYEKFFEI